MVCPVFSTLVANVNRPTRLHSRFLSDYEEIEAELVPITTEDRVNDLKSEWITDYHFKCQKKTRFNFVNVHLIEKAKF